MSDTETKKVKAMIMKFDQAMDIINEISEGVSGDIHVNLRNLWDDSNKCRGALCALLGEAYMSESDN